MGWSSGSGMAGEIFAAVIPHVPVDKQPRMVKHIFEIFEDADCDTMDELSDSEFAAVRKECRLRRRRLLAWERRHGY